MGITYTSNTAAVDIEVAVAADDGAATIAQVSSVDEPQTQSGIGTVLLWVGVGILAVMLIALLIIILVKRKKDSQKGIL